jgi:hypothetical protein
MTGLGMGVALYIQLDNHWMERQSKMATIRLEHEIRFCEAGGGKWFRGGCIEPVQKDLAGREDQGGIGR